jgi:hypothetical protein
MLDWIQSLLRHANSLHFRPRMKSTGRNVCTHTLQLVLATPANLLSDDPDTYENAAVCLQVLGQRFTEEKVVACLEVIEQALNNR